jgi:AraC-like DNA-binding protein
MPRERQVRLQFPAAFIELVRVLDTGCDKRAIASALSLPLSTVYRWTSQRTPLPIELQSGWTHRFDDTVAGCIDSLLAACQMHGFDLRRSVARLIPKALGHTTRELAASFEGGAYSFISRLSGQDVIGQVRFSPGTAGGVEVASNVLDIANGTSNLQSRLLRAKMEIDQHYYTRLSCDGLAQIVAMTKFNFIRAFRAAFGISPYQYLNQVRVEHAKHMLALTDQPLQLVAASVGFTSASSLARAFKRFAGASPANFLCKVAPALRSYPIAAGM